MDLQLNKEVVENILSNYVKKKSEAKDELSSMKVLDIPLDGFLSEDADLNTIRHNNLRLSSEIESIMSSSPTLLPDDKELLLNIAEDQSMKTSIQASQSLAYMTERKRRLQEIKQNYEGMVKRSEEVSEALEYLVSNRSEVDYLAELKIRHDNYGEIFKEMRQELQWFLNSRFPPDTDDKDLFTMEELMEAITKQFIEDPNDPYVDFEAERMIQSQVEYLIKCNIVSRHPRNSLKLRLNDFRRN